MSKPTTLAERGDLGGNTLERVMDYARAACERRERRIEVWRMGDRIGASADSPDGVKVIGSWRWNPHTREPVWYPLDTGVML